MIVVGWIFFSRATLFLIEPILWNLGCVKKVLADERVTAYAGFYEALKGKKFDLISIDAPFGAPVNIYARADVLDLVPSCLENEFIIMVDDYNRIGEQNMVTLLKEKLTNSKVEFVEGCYSGKKDTLVLASLNYRFLTTL